MCASPAQIAANRRNSLRSKGPTSEEGRRRSSQNAIKHGLTARVTTVLSSEDAAAFDEQMTGVVRTLNPRNPIEAMLARQAGQSAWMHDRAVRSQTARLSANIEDAEVRETEEVFRLGELLFSNRRRAHGGVWLDALLASRAAGVRLGRVRWIR